MMVLTLKIKGRRETNEMIDLKLASVKNIKILFADDTKIYLDYVISKYGKNYIKLYENKDSTANIIKTPNLNAKYLS